jgi:hypothetical protein
MSEDQEYGLIVSFEDQSGSYVHGFEAGQIWESMKRVDPFIEKMVHTENKETIRRMAHAEGYEMIWEPTEIAEWSKVKLTKTQKAKGGDLVSKGILKVIEGGADGDRA